MTSITANVNTCTHLLSLALTLMIKVLLLINHKLYSHYKPTISEC